VTAGAHEHHLAVSRTARYYTLGEAGPGTREVWFVLHGHGQLAAYFVRHFAALHACDRLIVAPEALSRFYLERTTWREAGKVRVGATWMTREDRLVEISDYIGYLDALYQHVLDGLDRGAIRVTVLGFSQGVATAARWLCRGRASAEAFVMWAGPFPPELTRDDVAPLRAMRLVRVHGERDDLAAPEVVAAADAHFAQLSLDVPVVRFDGGHRLDAGVLRSLAA
jgi:predicted esterase